MADFNFIGTSGMDDIPMEDTTDPALFRDFVNGSRVFICERMKLVLLWPYLKEGNVLNEHDQDEIEVKGRTSLGQNDCFLDLVVNHRGEADFRCLFRALRDSGQGNIVDTVFIEGHIRRSTAFACWESRGGDSGGGAAGLVADGPVCDGPAGRQARDGPGSTVPPTMEELLDILQPQEGDDGVMDVDDVADDVEGDSGHPVTVLIGNDGNFELDEAALRRVLLRPDVRDREVALISIAGAFRKGKSFLLDFFLRYLSAQNGGNWMGDQLAPLVGFTWRGGEDRETSGMVLWSKPFIVTRPNGQEIAVLLMDTQGVFDDETTRKECAIMFGLSIMLSSCTIYNLFSNIQEDDLQHLQFFTEYGRHAMRSTVEKPFQVLQFLVRDYTFGGFGKPLGAEGGQELLNKRLATSERQPAELRQLREYLRSCFSRLQCFLLPRPGDATEDPEFNGNIAGLRTDFCTHLADFIPSLAAPENLVAKEINGQRVTCGELFQYFKAYVEMFRGDDVPEPVSLYQATIAASLAIASKKATDNYRESMNQVLGAQEEPLHPSVFGEKHDECKQLALAVFQSAHNVASTENVAPAMERLEAALQDTHQALYQHNGTRFREHLLEKTVDHYRTQMNQVCGTDVGVEESVLNTAHEQARNNCVEMMENCGCEFTNLGKLNEHIHQTYTSFKYENEVKLQKMALEKARLEKEEAEQQALEAQKELEKKRDKSPDTVERVGKELARAERKVRRIFKR